MNTELRLDQLFKEARIMFCEMFPDKALSPQDIDDIKLIDELLHQELEIIGVEHAPVI